MCDIKRRGFYECLSEELIEKFSMEEQDHVVDFQEKKRQLEVQEVVLVLT